ncbi:MAG: hypothetical protein A3F46_02900 [Legionellales bacterium RIFCSPHIGHO2_12_FULL_42_9]|nr:MAG: hypothetical protein A3F46_02900 [Legionellales bacterium RIFCSPHIGHO2_12_FULL_42_9]
MRAMLAKTPLIVRLPNWVGDVIMTLPSLQALHNAGFDLQLFGQKWIVDLLHNFPAKLFQVPNSLFAARTAISNNPARNALLFTNNVSSALIARLSGKQPIGYMNTIRSCLLTNKIKKPSYLHEVEYFWKIAQLATSTWLPDATWPHSIPNTINLPIDIVCELKIVEKLKQEAIATPFIVLCPSAVGTAKNGIPKIWPYWSNLSETLHQQGIVHVVCPGPFEEERCRQLTPKAQFITGLNLSELAALFGQTDFVLANDSGPMHLAAAVGAPVLGIFGATDPKRTFPWGGHYIGEFGKWPSINEVLKHMDNDGAKNSIKSI